MGIAGAGMYGDLVDGAVGRVIDALDEKKPETAADCAVIIKAVLRRFNHRDVKDFPADREEYKQVVLLMALKPKRSSRADLWVANAATLNRVESHDVRGAGDVLAFVADRFFTRGMPLSQGILLAAYLLNLGREYVEGVGGKESHVLVLTSEGWLHEERVSETRFTEQFFEQIDKAIGTVLLSCADPSLSEPEFEARLTGLINDIKRARSEYVREFTDLHLGIAASDPQFKEPYQKIVEGARRVLNGIAYRYKYAEGRSGYFSPSRSFSPSASYSPSASSSPSESASASPSPSDDEESDS